MVRARLLVYGVLWWSAVPGSLGVVCGVVCGGLRFSGIPLSTGSVVKCRPEVRKSLAMEADSVV